MKSEGVGQFFIMWDFRQNFASISSNMRHHQMSQMSPWLLGYLMLLYLASYFQNAASWYISDVILASLISYDALFSIIFWFEHFFLGGGLSISLGIILAS